MPRYVGFTPQFNPVSLQEYLAVPTMIQQEFDTYEDKYNENLDKLAVLEGMTDESTRYLTDRYKDKLSNAADIIAGKSGNLSELRSQINNARQYYRETAPRLTNAYNKRQAALKAQQDILLKDPSAVTTKVGNMQSFLDNPDQVFHSLSGNKIYDDMLKAGQLSSADIHNPLKVTNFGRGYLKEVTQKGYTLAQQQEYANLVQQALDGNKDADKALRNNPLYAQPYQTLNKYIEDNKFNLFNDSEKAYMLNRALSGQLMGMTGTVEEKLIQDRAWDNYKNTKNAPKNYREALAAITGGSNTTFGNPVTQIGKFDNGVKTNAQRGNIITQTNGKTTIKDKKGVLTALHLPTDLKEHEYNYFIGDNGFKSIEELQTRFNTIKNKVGQLRQSGGSGQRNKNSGVREYTPNEKALLREHLILSSILNNKADYQNVVSQFNELNANYSVPSRTANTGISSNIPFMTQAPQTTSIGRLDQMIGQANVNVTADANAQRLGLTELGVGTIEYPLNKESLSETVAKVLEGNVEIYGIDRLSVNKEGDITPVKNKTKLSNVVSKVNGGEKYTHGALYNVPDADGFVLYMTDDKGTIQNFWVPGTQIDANYDSNFNIATDINGNKVKFSTVAKNAKEAIKLANLYEQRYNMNPTKENEQLWESAAEQAYIYYSIYKGDIDNRGSKMLDTRIYKTAGTYDINSAKPREGLQDNILDAELNF